MFQNHYLLGDLALTVLPGDFFFLFYFFGYSILDIKYHIAPITIAAKIPIYEYLANGGISDPESPKNFISKPS